MNNYLAPQFEYFGKGHNIMGARYFDIYGRNIFVGDHPTMVASPDNYIHLTTWSLEGHEGEIKIGKYCLITPGVRIASASSITIGDGCMFANSAYVSDADWHGIYDRAEPVGKTKPINIKENVWIGDSAIICKGVTIGANSIIGAGAVVTKNVPANSVYAGNPARLVKKLDDDGFVTRKDFYKDPKKLAHDFDMLDKYTLGENTFFNWIKSLINPDESH